MSRRIERINSLLREVISEVIQREVKNPHVSALITITGVETTKDLHHAKVFVSIIGTPDQRKETLEALQSARGFIAVAASKKVVLRYFPEIQFKLDDGAEHQARIEEILAKIRKSDDSSEAEFEISESEPDMSKSEE
jgi:ribosome-binding factor A